MGTALLVGGGLGAGLFSFVFVQSDGMTAGAGILGVAFAVGLAITAGAYAFGPISGAHFNPAVTLGVASAGRFPWSEVPAYLAAQVVGAVSGASLVALIAFSNPAFFQQARLAGFGANGFDEHSPGGFGVVGAIAVEIAFTALLIWIILATTATIGAAGFAPLAIGLAVTVLCLVAIPIDNASLNPARSLAVALYGQPWAWEQLWLFLICPSIGGVMAGCSYRFIFGREFARAV